MAAQEGEIPQVQPVYEPKAPERSRAPAVFKAWRHDNYSTMMMQVQCPTLASCTDQTVVVQDGYVSRVSSMLIFTMGERSPDSKECLHDLDAQDRASGSRVLR